MSQCPPRLSAKEMLILRLLTATPEMYGLEMIRASGGELKRGTLYVTLDRMGQKGYVESRTVAAKPGEQGPPRRGCHILPKGERALAAHDAALRAWMEEGEGE